MVRRQQGLDFAPQFGIALTRAIEKRRSVRLAEGHSFFQQLLHLLPAFSIHARASPVMAR